MRRMIFNYEPEGDVLFIQVKSKKSMVGDMEYQKWVILFRDEKNNDLVGIEILNFKTFKENKIQISKKKCMEFATPFDFLKKAISMLDIIGTYEFDNLMEVWGYKKVSRAKKAEPETDKINIPFPESEISTVALCH